jgi:hypothetical protein
MKQDRKKEDAMKLLPLRRILFTAVSLVAASPLWAQSPGDWRSLSPEQRQEMRQQVREHWQQMSPEERMQRRQAMQERHQMEDRERFRQEMSEQRREQRAMSVGGPPPGPPGGPQGGWGPRGGFGR